MEAQQKKSNKTHSGVWIFLFVIISSSSPAHSIDCTAKIGFVLMVTKQPIKGLFGL